MAPSSIAHQSNEDHTHSSMMAWRVHEFGPPDVMRFERILRPHPSPGEVPRQSQSRWGRSMGWLDQGRKERFAATTAPHSGLGTVRGRRRRAVGGPACGRSGLWWPIENVGGVWVFGNRKRNRSCPIGIN